MCTAEIRNKLKKAQIQLESNWRPSGHNFIFSTGWVLLWNWIELRVEQRERKREEERGRERKRERERRGREEGEKETQRRPLAYTTLKQLGKCFDLNFLFEPLHRWTTGFRSQNWNWNNGKKVTWSGFSIGNFRLSVLQTVKIRRLNELAVIVRTRTGKMM